MTPQQRQRTFALLFPHLPGRNIDRLNKAAEIMCCKVNTVRLALLKTDNVKHLSESKLVILRREMERKRMIPTETAKELRAIDTEIEQARKQQAQSA